MSSIDDLATLDAAPPTGWRPGVEWDGQVGHVTTYPMSEQATDDTWDHVLEKFGLDPDKYMVDGNVRHSVWDVPGHGLQRSYRARIVERPEHRADVEELLDLIGDPVDIHRHPLHDGWRTIVIADTHIGKGEADGGGTDAIVERWKKSVVNAIGDQDHVGIHLAFLGDLVEGYVSQNGKNISGCDLTLTEQLRVARHLVTWTVTEALAYADHVIVSATPGNHGEATRVQNVPHTDSYDLDIVSAVQEAFSMSEDADRVTWYYPQNSAHLTYKVGDTTFTCAHGHLFKGKMQGAEKWWAGMTVNGREPGAAQILLSGHFHSAQFSNFTRDKWIMFAPSLETQSTWFAESTGATSLPGMLTFVTSNGKPKMIEIV